ncbi:hypothetical protein WKI68_10785 [Streptomyces sp. MS1.HAVA.3]|uniref:Integral membrane protein n=1 Tax=Streptomyces caledonius TaxID=3134107 RepID=A0ABU8U1R1_9ACTN
MFGLVLLVLAELFVLPEQPGPSYRRLAAEAADTAARCAAELRRAPYTLSAASIEAARTVGEALRPSRIDEADRPAGPGLRDRALAHAGLSARTLLNRMARLPAPPPGGLPPEQGPEVLIAVGRAAAETAALLDGEADETDAAGALRRVRAQATAAAVLEESSTRPGAADGRRCWRWRTPPWPSRRRPSWRYGAGARGFRPRPTRAASGMPATSRPACGGTGWRPTPVPGRCTSRTPSGSASRLRQPGRSRAWSRCPTASGRCWPSSA